MVTQTSDMLRTKFWTGLRRDIKDVSGHKFDSIKDYDKLLIAVRQIERDHQDGKEVSAGGKKPTKNVQKAEKDRTLEVLKNLTDRLESIEAKISQQQVKEQPATEQRQRYGYQNKHRGQQEHSYRGKQEQQKYKARPEQHKRHRQQNSDEVTDEEQMGDERRDTRKKEEPTCWRCGQVGHLRYGCRVRLDHLNLRESP